MPPLPASRRLFLISLLALSGCASKSELTAIKLDTSHPKYRTTGCQDSIAGSRFHMDAKQVSMVASPALIFVSGGLLLPVVAANAALDYADRVDASNMATRCGARGETQAEIVEHVSTGAVMGVASNIVPLPKPK